jgi:transcriptional regulator with XRE-family HTH domain
VDALADVIAANVKRLRSVSQDSLAGFLRMHGLEWTANNVAYLESGHYEPSLSELVILATVLDVPPSALLATAEPAIALNATAKLSGDVVRSLLRRQKVEIDTPGNPVYDDPLEWMVAGVRDRAIKQVASEAAVMHLARSFGKRDGAFVLSPYQIAELALNIWHRSFSDLRDELSRDSIAPADSKRTVAIKKAHVTRQLKKQIEAAARERGWLTEERT